MSSSLRFLGGTNTVGGVQVMVTGRTGRLVFDLGVIGNPAIVRSKALFHSLLPVRDRVALLDYLRAGMAPLVENLYDRTVLDTSVARATERLRATGFLLADFPLIVDTSPEDMCVFISHLHEDHMMLLPFVNREVPVLMSEGGARLHAALVASGALPSVAAAVHPVPAGTTRRVGDLTVEVLDVDHDLPGSAGIVVETPDGSIAYTGDWRLHGRHPELMKSFVERCTGVDVLLTEASTAVRPGSPATTLANISERAVVDAFDKLLASSRRGAYCSFHERNLERQSEIRDIAQAHNKTLVLSARTYAIWQHAAAAGFADLDTSRGVAVWGDDGVDGERGAGDGVGAAAGGSSASVAVTPSDVAADPRAFVCELRRWDRPRMLDLAAGPGDIYVYMNGYPHGPADPGWPVLETWLRELAVEFHAFSSHGHALPADLQWLVEAIRPKVVVPVHTNAPDYLPALSAPVRVASRGDEMSLSGTMKRM